MELPAVWGNEQVWFFNWTNEKFIYPWGKEDYTFAPGQKMLFPIGICYHFAKHLAEHAFNSKNKTYNVVDLDALIDKAMLHEGVISGVSAEKANIMAMNAKAEAAAPKAETVAPEKPKNKGGRPKKVPAPVVDDLAGFEGK